MTAHFMVDFKLMSVMLACRRYSGSHTGEEILQHYEDSNMHLQLRERLTILSLIMVQT